MTSGDLSSTERATFRAAFDIGVWDILIATGVSMFAIGPYLSGSLGDFWSAAVFVPILALVYLVLRLVKGRLVAPRLGVVHFGPYRVGRLRKLATVLAIVNVLALGLGAYFAFNLVPGSMWVFPIVFSLLVLLVFSLASYFLVIPRFFLYGLLLAVAPLVGEWLFREGYAPHHGYPVVYGISAVVIASVGFITLITRLHGLRASGSETAA